MKLIFASHNQHKVDELKAFAQQGQFEILSLTELGFYDEIEETGSTLEENALIKARAIYNIYQTPVFAEDTGLEVEELNNEPGVKTARYAGEAKSATDNMELLLHNLSEILNRRAQFRAVIAYIAEGEERLFEGIIRGSISTHKTGNQGFGYDPIFVPEGYEQSFAELGSEIKESLSHRVRAFQKLMNHLDSKSKNPK